MKLAEKKSSGVSRICILAIDDDPDIIETLQAHILPFNLDFISAQDGEEGLRLIREKKPDLVILDINMPCFNGLEICEILRKDKAFTDLPIILLSGRNLDVDRVQGLELGADDYVTKPFNARELVLRMESLLKRVYGRRIRQDILTLGELTIDFDAHNVQVAGQSVALTLTEFQLLTVLVKNAGRVKSRDALLEEVWHHAEDVFSRTVDTHIQRLRKKLEDSGRYIETVRGIGYRFQPESY